MNPLRKHMITRADWFGKELKMWHVWIIAGEYFLFGFLFCLVVLFG